jgi:hypothetical protein
MASTALLVLEDGTTFAGKPLGASGQAHGEVVFSWIRAPRVETRGMEVRA